MKRHPIKTRKIASRNKKQPIKINEPIKIKGQLIKIQRQPIEMMIELVRMKRPPTETKKESKFKPKNNNRIR